MFSRWFSRTPTAPDLTEWWTRANREATHPTDDGLRALRGGVVDAAAFPDLAEAQEEFLDGLAALMPLQAAPALPIVDTQHRVIGGDACHFLTPASLADQVDAGGKLFVTSARVILATGNVQSWPWHSVSAVQRVERDVILVLRGRPPVQLRLNSYEAALIVAALAGRLSQRPG